MITLIAAIAENGCIGIRGKLPWHLPEDMARFKALTIGHVVLMGRKTWESLPPKFRPLPGRTNVVVTTQEQYEVPPGVERYATIDDALRAHTNDDVYVIGGAQLYAQTIDCADRLSITLVHRIVHGDAFFPEIATRAWSASAREEHDGYAFVTYERAKVRVDSTIPMR